MGKKKRSKGASPLQIGATVGDDLETNNDVATTSAVRDNDLGADDNVDMDRDNENHTGDNGGSDVDMDRADERQPGRTQESYDAATAVVKVPKNDYYGILGLDKTCTPDQIQKQYRKLARVIHPDKNQWPDCEEAFQRMFVP